MKRKMGWASLILAVTVMLAACSSNAGNNSEKNNSSASDSGNGNEAPYELTMAYFTFGAVPQDLLLIQDEVNKIAQQKINVNVKLLPISFSAWTNQVNLMLTSNEKLDLMPLFGSSYANMVAKGQLIELDGLLKNKGNGIQEALGPDYSSAAIIAGKTYAVPSIRDFASSYGFLMRKDLADKHNIDTNGIKTLDDLEMVLKTFKENEPGISPLAVGVNASPIASYSTIDSLGDNMGVLLNNGQELKVVNWFETQEYADNLKRMRNWNQAGYIPKDAITIKDSTNDQIKAGKAAGNLAPTKPGFAKQESRISGNEMVVAEMLPAVAKTSTVTNIMWGIAPNSKNPEKAMEFLNLMYSDKEIVNLLDWGIEGKHYTKVSDNVIDFPQGVNAGNVGYTGAGWLFGNQLLSYTFNGDDPEQWNKLKEFNDNAIKSMALGFTFDSSSVKTEVAAVTNVMLQYQMALENGVLDPDKGLPEFISKLKDAGIDKVITEKQKQLDAWAAAKK